MQSTFILEPISAGAGEIQVPAAGRARVGREATNEFSFPHDMQMSSVHFEIGAEAGGCRIWDLGSSNGLFLNTKRVSTAIVVEGDEIQAGGARWHLVVRHNESPTPAAQTDGSMSPIQRPTDGPTPVWHSGDQPQNQSYGPELKLTSRSGLSRRLAGSQRLTIGRTMAAQWIFENDEQMSSCHMELSQQAGVWKVTDLASSNGTFVNGSRVNEVQLYSGDEIRGGQTFFEVSILTYAPAQPGRQQASLPNDNCGATDTAAPAAALDESLSRSAPRWAGDQATQPSDLPGNGSSSHACLRRLSDGQEFDLAINRLVSVGRSPESLISLANDPEVSTQHATLLFDGDCLRVRDVGSSNGTFVRSERIIATELAHGDRLRVGKTEFVVCLPQPEEPSNRDPIHSDTGDRGLDSGDVVDSDDGFDSDDALDDVLDGDVLEVDALEADVVEADVLEADVLDGDVLDGDVVEGDVVEGDVVDGDVLEVDALEDDVVEADVVEGDVLEADALEDDVVGSSVGVNDGASECSIARDTGLSPEGPDAQASDSTNDSEPKLQSLQTEPLASFEPKRVVSTSGPIDLHNKDLYAKHAAALSALACRSGLSVYLGEAVNLQPVDVCLSLLRATSGWVLNGSEIENWIEAASQGLSGLPREWLSPSYADDASWMLPFLGNWGTSRSWLVLSHGQLEEGLNSLRSLRQPTGGSPSLLESLTPTSLAEFLMERSSDLVQPFFAPFDAVLIEVGRGERWAIVGRPELEAILKNSDL